MTVKKAYVDTEEGQVHYRHAGEPGNGTTVAFFHQNPSSSQMYEEVMAELRDEYHVVAMDMPGYGQSYVPRTVSSFGYYARTLSQALSNLGVESVHAVGHHTGADVATELAVREPDRVRTLCLIGPPYLPGEELEERLEESYGDPPVPPLDEEGSYLLDHWKRMRREGGTLETTHRMTVDALVAREGNRQAFAAERGEDLPTLFGQVECPRLIMCSRDDVLWDVFHRAREDNPGVPSAVVGRGTWEPMMDPAGVADELRSFLRDDGY